MSSVVETAKKIMFNEQESKKQHQNSWSLKMLELFRNSLEYSIPPRNIMFIIKDKVTNISLDINTMEENITYGGSICADYKELEDVYFALNSVYSLKDLKEEYQNYIGYIEILNSSLDFRVVPMIRGFIKYDLSFFKSINEMLIESRMINKLLALNVVIDLSRPIDPTEKIFEMICAEKIFSLPIERVDIYQKISFDLEDTESK